jgi:hypothetical protein
MADREPGRDRREDDVARRVPEAVVDLLKPVGVNHDHGRVVAVAGQELARWKRALQAFDIAFDGRLTNNRI